MPIGHLGSWSEQLFRSLLPKMDMVRIWVKSTGADVVIISETWLSKSINNEDIYIFGYNVYRTDRP